MSSQSKLVNETASPTDNGYIEVHKACCSKPMVIVNKNLTGQVAIVTGSNTGIGKETARILAKAGATVILACRNAEKTGPVVEDIKKTTSNQNVEFMKIDLSDLRSVKEFVEKFKSKYQQLNLLINNAGLVDLKRKLSKDGYELTFATNHIGPHYLTTLLLDLIKTSYPARIVNTASEAINFGKMNWDDLMFEKKYKVGAVYAQSKISNVLFTKELNKRLEGTHVKAVSLHPGAVVTELGHGSLTTWYLKCFYYAIAKPLLVIFGKSAVQGAQTTIYCALEDNDKLLGGSYYDNCKLGKESKACKVDGEPLKLWEITENLISKALGNS